MYTYLKEEIKPVKQVASLRYDVIFKKAFCQPDVFTAFVKDFLGLELQIDRVETDKAFSPVIGNVATKFDLYAEDQQNRVIVDIQHEHYPDHYDRFLHYHCCALIEQIANSKNYRPGLRVFTLVVLTSGDRHQTDWALTDFDPKKRDGQPLGELPHQLLFVCPKYVNAETPPQQREWLLAIQDSLDEQVDETQYPHSMIQKVFQTIEKNLVTPEERARMFEEYNQEQKKRTDKEEIARNLLSLRLLSVEQIAQVTGLTIAEVKALSID
jgi:hypothetical protein